MSSIYLPRSSFEDMVRDGRALACVKIPYKGYEISIAMDDSCGAFRDLQRSDLCVFDVDGENVTKKLFDLPGSWGIVRADAENLKVAFSLIDKVVEQAA